MSATHLYYPSTMKRAARGTRQRLLPLIAVVAAVGWHTAATAQTSAQPGDFPVPTERFDLVIYGFDFDPGEHELFLRSNLDYGAEWVSFGPIDPAPRHSDDDAGWTAVVFADISTERFLGQDFRESYLEVRIGTRSASDGSLLSAIYAMPHLARAPEAAPRIAHLIESDPVRVKHHSLASHVQPAPQTLGPGPDYVQHVQAPMKHTLPGVAEVEQLQVEWRNRSQ